MDLVTGVERVQVLGVVKVPEHGGTVLASGSTQGSIGRNGDDVDISGVSVVVCSELASAEFPDLHCQHTEAKKFLIQFRKREEEVDNQTKGDIFDLISLVRGF